MITLVEFLRARHAEQAERAPSMHALACELTMSAGYHGPCTCGVPDLALAEVDGRRRIIDMIEQSERNASHDAESEAQWFLLAKVGRCLAIMNADHPDFRQEWKP